MGSRNLKQMGRIVKEAVDRTLLISKFLCFLHVTNKYLCTIALVSNLHSSRCPSSSSPLFTHLEDFWVLFRCMVPVCSRPSTWRVTWFWLIGSRSCSIEWVTVTSSLFDPLKTLGKLLQSAWWAWKVIGSPSFWTRRVVTDGRLLLYDKYLNLVSTCFCLFLLLKRFRFCVCL